MHMGVLPVSLCTVCLLDICAGQKKALTTLKIITHGYKLVCGIELRSSGRATSALNHRGTSPTVYLLYESLLHSSNRHETGYI